MSDIKRLFEARARVQGRSYASAAAKQDTGDDHEAEAGGLALAAQHGNDPDSDGFSRTLAAREVVKSYAGGEAPQKRVSDEEHAMCLAALLHALTEHDEGEDGGKAEAGRSFAFGGIPEHISAHLRGMAGHIAGAHAHLRPHVEKIASAAAGHFSTIKAGAGHFSAHIHDHVVPHAKQYLGEQGRMVARHLASVPGIARQRARNYVGSFKRYGNNLREARNWGHATRSVYQQTRQAAPRKDYSRARPGVRTINQSHDITRHFAADEADEGSEEDQAQGLALASHFVHEGLSPEEHDALLHEAHGEADEGERSFALFAPPTRMQVAGIAGNVALDAATRHRNKRVTIRARAVSHIRNNVTKHAGRASLATLTPIATARVGLSYALDHKRNRLKGVGLRGNLNAMNASHYLTHHRDTVERIASTHKVSPHAAAHALAYQATAMHRPAGLRAKGQTEASNQAYHRELGQRAATHTLKFLGHRNG